MEDLPVLMQIIEDARQRMKEQGIPQWQNGYPNEAVLLEDIRKGAGWVWQEGEEIAAMTALFFDPDPTYARLWEGEWQPGGQYGTIHRLAVAKTFLRKGCGRKIIAAAKEYCLARGITELRVDTHRRNLPMQRLLTGSGFTFCGVIYLYGEETPETERITAQAFFPPEEP